MNNRYSELNTQAILERDKSDLKDIAKNKVLITYPVLLGFKNQ